MRTIAPLLAATVLVVAGIGLAFSLTGSPHHQRDLAFDRTRVELLQDMTTAIAKRYGEAKHLPATLPATLIKSDPESGKPLEYRRTSATAYEVCAVFAQPSTNELYYHDWDHGKGHQCFVHAIE